MTTTGTSAETETGTGTGRNPPLVRLGVIGLGSVFEPYAALMRELIYEERLQVVATCDTEPSRAQRVRRFLRQDAPFTTDYTEVLARDDIDARFAVVTTGFTMQDYRSPAIELYGTRGVAQMLGDDWAPQGYEMNRSDAPGWTTFAEVDTSWPWTSGLRHMVDCLIDGSDLLIQPSHAYHCLDIMVKAQLAASTGQAQVIESTVDPVPYRPEEIYVQRGGKVGHDVRIHRDDDHS